MEQEHLTIGQPFPCLLSAFKTKLRKYEVIEIPSDSDSIDFQPSKLNSLPSSPSHFNLTTSSKNLQEDQNQGEAGPTADSGARLRQKSESRLQVITTSNCHFDFSSHIPPSNCQTFTQSSSPNQSPSASEDLDLNRPQARKKNHFYVKKQKKEKILINRARVALQLFNQNYSESQDLAEKLKNDLWIPQVKQSPKEIKELSSSSSSQPPFNGKMTRRHFKSLKPFLEASSKEFNDLDLEEELKRLEIGRYRYKYSIIINKINQLASKVNVTYLKKKTAAFVAQNPIIPLHSSKHATMVNLLRQRLAKRAVIYVD